MPHRVSVGYHTEMSDTVQQIKDKLNITDVVSTYVKLSKAGKYLRGLSPFTKEKTPSFFVNPERNTYYCFSTAQGGDAFTFIEKMEGVDFKGALKILAEKAGVEIEEYQGGKDKGKTERLREALARAEALYTRSLDVKGSAYAYATSRGLTPETIRTWNLGYAPDAWRTLLEELSAAGHTTPELIAAGLIKEADEKRGTYYDRFRNRLMFPIKDSAGRTVAFTGRTLGDDLAKYLNSPETELYKKSEILYGMDKAKDAIRTRGFAVLVEGQFDLILLHQIGFQNTVALSGTALSTQHVSLIKRYADNLMLCLDADRAGLAASEKTALAALASGMRVKAVRIPLGKDPADLAGEDSKAFAKLVAEAESVVEFFLSVLSAEERDQHKLVLAIEARVLPLVAAIPSPMEREHFIGIIARTLGQAPEAIRAAMPRGSVGHTSIQNPTSQPSTSRSPRVVREEMLRGIVWSYPDSALAQRIKTEYARITSASMDGEPPSERTLFEAGLTYGETPDENAADDLIRSYEQAVLIEQLADASARLRRAEAAKDQKEIQEAAQACNAISGRLASFS